MKFYEKYYEEKGDTTLVFTKTNTAPIGTQL